MGTQGSVRSKKTGGELTKSLDRPVLAFCWTFQGIKAVIDDMGTEPIIEIRFESLKARKRSRPRHRPPVFPRLVTGGVQTGLNANPKSGRMVFTHHTSVSPAEVYTAGSDGSGLTQLTHHNAPLIEQLDLTKLDPFVSREPMATKFTAGFYALPDLIQPRNIPSFF